MASENKYKIWSRFTAIRETDGAVLNFRIQDLPEDRFEEALELYMKYFPTGEAFQKASGMYKNEKARAEYREIIKLLLQQSNTHSDVCFLDDGSEPAIMAGISIMSLINKDDEDITELLKEMVSTEEVAKFYEIISGLGDKFDVFKTCGVQKSYEGRGVLVNPDYRRLGIAIEFLKTRRLVCQAEGVPITKAWMTAIGTQKAATRDGWQTGVEVPKEEIEQQFNVIIDVGAPTLKVMYAKIN